VFWFWVMISAVLSLPSLARSISRTQSFVSAVTYGANLASCWLWFCSWYRITMVSGSRSYSRTSKWHLQPTLLDRPSATLLERGCTLAADASAASCFTFALAAAASRTSILEQSSGPHWQ
jgi:hypothetical protein